MWDRMCWNVSHTSLYFLQFSASYITPLSYKCHFLKSESSDSLPRYLPQFTSVFFLPFTSYLSTSIALQVFLFASIPSSTPISCPRYFAVPFIYIYLFTSFLLVAPSPVICLPIVPYLKTALDQHPFLQTSLPLCFEENDSGHRGNPTCALINRTWKTRHVAVVSSAHCLIFGNM